MFISSADEYDPDIEEAPAPPPADDDSDDEEEGSAWNEADPNLPSLPLPLLLRVIEPDELACDVELAPVPTAVQVWPWKIPSTKFESVQLPIRCKLRFSGCCSRHRINWFITPAAKITSLAETDLPPLPPPVSDDEAPLLPPAAPPERGSTRDAAAGPAFADVDDEVDDDDTPPPADEEAEDDDVEAPAGESPAAMLPRIHAACSYTSRRGLDRRPMRVGMASACLSSMCCDPGDSCWGKLGAVTGVGGGRKAFEGTGACAPPGGGARLVKLIPLAAVGGDVGNSGAEGIVHELRAVAAAAAAAGVVVPASADVAAASAASVLVDAPPAVAATPPVGRCPVSLGS
jgi:hypothetical protein